MSDGTHATHTHSHDDTLTHAHSHDDTHMHTHSHDDKKEPRMISTSNTLRRIQQRNPMQQKLEKLDLKRQDLNEIKSDILTGQDGLSAIVNQICKKSERADRFFHCAARVGCSWADQRRTGLMGVAVVIGVVCAVCALAGALGLSEFGMKSLPWGGYDSVPLFAGDMVWWACGGGNSAEAGCYPGAAFQGPSSPLIPGGGGANASLARFFSAENTALAGRFAAGADLEAETKAAIATNAVVTTGSWYFNQWGMCLFPDEQWTIDAMAFSQEPVRLKDGGICRKWNHVGSWAPAALMRCKRNLGVDGFSLVMGAFGALMKVVEPLSRMRRETDQHQKTIMLLVLVVAMGIPLIGVVSFGTVCLVGITESFSARFGEDSHFGAGALCFLFSTVLLVPVFALHLVVPAAASTSRGPAVAPAAPPEVEARLAWGASEMAIQPVAAKADLAPAEGEEGLACFSCRPEGAVAAVNKSDGV